MCKVEEALKGSCGLALNLSKVIAQLPDTALGSNDKVNMQDMEIAVKEQESLTHIIVNGTLPGQSNFIGVNELKNVIKSFHVHFIALRKAVDTASRAGKRRRSRNTEAIIRRHGW